MTKKFIAYVKIGNSRPYYLTENNMYSPDIKKANIFDCEEDAKKWVQEYRNSTPEICKAYYLEYEENPK